MRRVLKRLQFPLPHETDFNAADNPCTSSEFLKLCEDYGVPNDPKNFIGMKNFIGLISMVLVGLMTTMTQWFLKKSEGFTDVGLYRISESVRAYTYLILSSQASARSSIVENTASALTAQSAF